MRPMEALKSSFAKPWLLSASASGGPEIVVTEYRTPTPAPKGTPAAPSSEGSGRRRHAAGAEARPDGGGRAFVALPDRKARDPPRVPGGADDGRAALAEVGGADDDDQAGVEQDVGDLGQAAHALSLGGYRFAHTAD